MTKTTTNAPNKPAAFSNWLSFLSGNEDGLMALVLASEWKPAAKKTGIFQKPQMNLSGHFMQVITRKDLDATA